MMVGRRGNAITMKIGLIGDHDQEVPAHKAIPIALQLAADKSGIPIEWQWNHSNEIDWSKLRKFDGIWCVPASPYKNSNNVLEAIKYAREHNIPFLGTCGGYQYAAWEFARNKLGHEEADNSEINPDTRMPIISSLVCKLYDMKASVELTANSVVAMAYGQTRISEEYFCGFGVNREYLHLFKNTDLEFTGFDEDGDPRTLEIPGNRFFVGTAFQPERSAFDGTAHPLICAYLNAVKYI